MYFMTNLLPTDEKYCSLEVSRNISHCDLLAICLLPGSLGAEGGWRQEEDGVLQQHAL